MHTEFIRFAREYFDKPRGPLPLHQAHTGREELEQLQACLASGQLSSVGKKVEEFEQAIAHQQQLPFAVATQSGTAALHLALLTSGLQAGDLVITQPFAFVASCNAIRYCGADAIFVDIERQSLGLCPESLLVFLEEETEIKEDDCYHKASGKRISHCLPVCTFGHPPQLAYIEQICQQYGLTLIVDAAEALGSTYRGKPVSHYGRASVLSFNGNKIITCGGGGMLLTHEKEFATKAHHLSQQARSQQQNRITYDDVGYNYRMPALNAALGLGQLSQLDKRLSRLRQLTEAYQAFFHQFGQEILKEPPLACSNYWLQTVAFSEPQARDAFVASMQSQQVDCRPAWTLMPHLPVYRDCICADIPNARWAEQHLALLPSLNT